MPLFDFKAEVKVNKLLVGRKKLRAATFMALQISSNRVAQFARTNATKNFKDPSPSGGIKDNIRSEVVGEGADVVARIGVVGKPAVYAGVQEGMDKKGNTRTSTTIKKKGPHLTIPLSFAKGKGRRPKVSDFTGTFTRRSKAGNLIIFQKIAEGIRPLFVLKDQVKVPATPFLRPALGANLTFILSTLKKEWDKALKMGKKP